MEGSLVGQPLQENEQLMGVRSAPRWPQLEAVTLQRALRQLLGLTAEPAPENQTKLPYPATHAVSVAVRQGTLRTTIEGLAKNGFVHFHRFSVLPSFKAPRWLLPLGDTHQMLAGWQVYAPYATAARLLKAVFLRVVRAGWKGWGCSQLLVASNGPLPLEGLVREVTGEPGPLFALSLGTQSAFRKISVQVMRPSGELLGYLKFPLAEAAEERVRHESEVLERLWRFSALRPHIPRILHAGRWGDGYILFQSPGPSWQGPVDFGPLHESFLRTLWGIHRVERPGPALVQEVAARWQNSASLMEAELWRLGNRALERAGRELDGLTVPCGISHGDFAPWNTRAEPGRLFVFDWESAAWDAPILWDMFHFHVQVASELNKNSGWWVPASQTQVDKASFLLYLLSSLCQCFEEEVGARHSGTEHRKRILFRQLS